MILGAFVIPERNKARGFNLGSQFQRDFSSLWSDSVASEVYGEGGFSHSGLRDQNQKTGLAFKSLPS